MGLAQQQSTWEEEFRGFLGMDKRTDRSRVRKGYFTESVNTVLEQGISKTRLGSTLWGSLDIDGFEGTPREIIVVDAGDTELVLHHRGTTILWGEKGDSVPVAVEDLESNPLEVEDEEGDFEPYGYTVGTSGTRVIKVLFRQAAGCVILEYDTDSETWIGRNAGIQDSAFRFAVSAAGGGSNPPGGTVRVRRSARRKPASPALSSSSTTA